MMPNRVLLLTGGGSEWLRAELLGAFPGSRWVAEPRWANVRGFYRYVLMMNARQRSRDRATEMTAGE